MAKTLTAGILILIGSIPAKANDEADIVVADFEAADYGSWKTTGEAFGPGPAQGTLNNQNIVSGYIGERLVNSFFEGDPSTGTLTSEPFEIQRKFLCFLVGGGNGDNVGMKLLIDDQAVLFARGSNSEELASHKWNVEAWMGKTVTLQIFDHAIGGWGHICVDQIVQSDNPNALDVGIGKPAKTVRLSTYRNSAEYYREKYRPQFHFTPEVNWMNDPNGLVYYDGEYHLFYQHNPHGNEWGHMSWGHAVSTDLVSWKHLPIALHEEYGVMIFSGCCVIDHKNTSGFGLGGKPPMIAIYSGHGHGLQTQDVAYSNDRGRTWTKYSGNPVIDIGMADFRDPKVFWHEPTKRWIMVVSKAIEKVLSFYGSSDLKKWRHLSDFGPAGVSGKPNWECPDLFELTVEGTKESKWVLEVDMGGGSVAGGSGGEYFVGNFDGTRFECEHQLNRSQWVDYGRDFYAPVSFSDIPESDGRRIWIGWMNNWETHLVPTHPWRSAMSVPRSLSLRKKDKRYVLIQRPVKELASLRREHIQFGPVKFHDRMPISKEGLNGIRYELMVEFENESAREFGLELRVGENEKTVLGFDVSKKELFVDRRQSGAVDFHPQFAGKHVAPLKSESGKLRLHILVDDSSIEVFADDGAIVITDRIFPDATSTGINLYSVGGSVKLNQLDFWNLRSIWH